MAVSCKFSDASATRLPKNLFCSEVKSQTALIVPAGFARFYFVNNHFPFHDEVVSAEIVVIEKQSAVIKYEKFTTAWSSHATFNVVSVPATCKITTKEDHFVVYDEMWV